MVGMATRANGWDTGYMSLAQLLTNSAWLLNLTGSKAAPITARLRMQFFVLETVAPVGV